MAMTTTMTEPVLRVTLGIDTHKDLHVAAALDELGRLLGILEVPATVRGSRRLLAWAQGFGAVARAGVEGTGCYGAALTRFLLDAGVEVIEVNRPNRQLRRRRGKSDPTDAEAAARAVLSGEARATPKSRDGVVESIRVLRVARSSAVKARTQVTNQIRDLLLGAPESLRVELQALRSPTRATRCARLRTEPGPHPEAALRRALRHLGRRWRALTAEIRALDTDLGSLLSAAAPQLLAERGVGIESAAKLLIAAGDNPEHLGSEAALAALCGANPIEASSGKTVRHRLNRGGDRQANNALWTIVRHRLRHDPETRAYADRRTKEGLSERDITRCLKRFLARRLYPLVLEDLAHARRLPLT
jgi:transposase